MEIDRILNWILVIGISLIGIVFVISAFTDIYYGFSEETKTENCYDRYSNLIKNQVCEKKIVCTYNPTYFRLNTRCTGVK